MCLIIVTKTPTTITRAVAASALSKNSDGIGVMWYDKAGTLQSRKWLKATIKKWWPEFRAIAEEAEAAGSELAVHWRMATHGEVSTEMCHPFALATPQGEALMMHNGIISGYGERSYSVVTTGKGASARAEPAKSDTWEYARVVEAIIADGSAKLLSNAVFLALLGDDVTSSNKLVFGLPSNPEKTFSVVNPDAGVWFDGHWFSNTYAWDAKKLSKGKVGTESGWGSRHYSSCSTVSSWDYLESNTVGTRGPLKMPVLGQSEEYQAIMDVCSQDLSELESYLVSIENPSIKLARLQVKAQDGVIEDWELMENTRLIVDEYCSENGI